MTQHTQGKLAVLQDFPYCIVPESDAHKKNGGCSDPEQEHALYAKLVFRAYNDRFTAHNKSRVMPDEAVANAKELVKRWNAHDALVAACKGAIKALGHTGQADTPDYPTFQDICAALAQAETDL